MEIINDCSPQCCRISCKECLRWQLQEESSAVSKKKTAEDFTGRDIFVVSGD